MAPIRIVRLLLESAGDDVDPHLARDLLVEYGIAGADEVDEFIEALAAP